MLRDLRKMRALSQDELGHQAAFSRNYIGNLERGEKSPSLTALFTLARVLAVEPEEMIRQVRERMQVVTVPADE